MAKSRSSRATNRQRAAVVCTPGLEQICAAELEALGCRPKPAGPGLLEFNATPRQLYSANVWLRTASRVIVRIDTFRATDFFHLQDHASRIDWARWVPNGYAPRFKISSNDSKLYHTKAIAQRLHQVSLPPSIGEPEQLFIVRIDRNNVTISADSSGQALHKRPWRTELGEAPLRTTMAAAMLLSCRWSPDTGLIDPFCGSGTIGIEGALLASRRPPGGDREFAFHHWPDFEPGSWASVVGAVGSLGASVAQEQLGPILMSDRDSDVVAAAIRNAERAGVADRIEFEKRVVAHLKGRTGSGMVVTNPPYGKRLGRGELKGLYGRLGAVVRERLADYGLMVLTPDSKLAKTADGRLRSVARFRHGGLAVEMFHRPPPVTEDKPSAEDPTSQGEPITPVEPVEPVEDRTSQVEPAEPASIAADDPEPGHRSNSDGRSPDARPVVS
ncbi:MAG: THUMP domain-containing class I SAM-dependent RNA methyltransferase [Acidimicrobiales bacterium]